MFYLDVSFNTNADNSSQIGFIFLPKEDTEKACIIMYEFRKSRRVIRSSLTGETVAIAYVFDCAYILKHDLQRMLGKFIPLLLVTDSKFLFDVITGNRYTSEARLMVDILAVREAYNIRIIYNIAYIRRMFNISDALTKVVPNQFFNHLLCHGKIDHPIELYIISN